MSERTITFDGIKLKVQYDYQPAEVGARERRTGVQLEPDVDEEINLEGVLCVEDIMELLDGHTVEYIEAQILKEINEPPDEG